MMKRIILTIFITALVTSCSTITPQAPAPKQQKLSWQARQQILSRINSWRLDGKIAVRTAQDSGSATLNWRQQGSRFNIALSGPLGAGAMQINGQPGHVTLKSSDGKEFSANSAEQLLARQWGFRLPVSYLRYWIRGLPAPGAAHKDQFDEYHRLSSFTQRGYHVKYLAYSRTKTIDLPAKLSITSPALKSKIIVYSWRV